MEHLLFEQVGVLAFHVPVVLAEEVVEGSGGVGRVVLGNVELVHVLAFTFDARLFGVLLSEILSPFEDLFRVPFVDHAAGDIREHHHLPFGGFAVDAHIEQDRRAFCGAVERLAFLGRDPLRRF